MKIAIAGGNAEADFLIGLLLKKKHKLAVINESADICDKISGKYGISVYCADPCKYFALEEAGIENFDVIMALTESDADNLQIGQSAKKLFNVKRAICIVSNPKNVEIFKDLGINTAISAAYTIAQAMEQASGLEELVRQLTIEDKIVLTEIETDEESFVSGKSLSEIKFPENIRISCILRGGEMIIPTGGTVIAPGDKLMFVSSVENQKKVFGLFKKGGK